MARTPLAGYSRGAIERLWEDYLATNPTPEEQQAAFDDEFGPALAEAAKREQAYAEFKRALRNTLPYRFIVWLADRLVQRVDRLSRRRAA